MKLAQVPVPGDMYEQWMRSGAASIKAFVETKAEYSIFLGHEPIGGGPREVSPIDYRWHLSVAGRTHLPTWADFVAVAHELRPGVVFCAPIPPREWWLNVHEFCLHAWEIKDANLIEQWRADGQGDEPS